MKKCKTNYILLSLIMLFVFMPGLKVLAENAMNVERHSADEIRARIKNCGASINDATVYDRTPSSTAPYDPGQLSAATKNSAVTILNNMRYIAGIDATVGLKDEYGEQAQAGSYLNYLNSSLSHYPERPDGVSDELYSLGSTGAGSSNIAAGYSTFGSAIVNGWMKDSDSSNISRVGHRRWILSPGMKYTGFGMAGRYSAMYAFDGWYGYQGYKNIAWPAQKMPLDYFTTYYPWSLSTGNTEDKSSIKVTLTRKRDQKAWQFSEDSADGYFNVDNGNYGMTGCVIFRPDNIESYVAGDVFQVNIEGLKDGALSYEVEFFELNPHIHDLTAMGAKDATCTKAGNTAYWACGCGKYFSDANGNNEITKDSVVIPAKGHTMTKTEAKVATCTDAGNSAYWTCSRCANYFSDSQGKTEIAKDSWIIKAKGHTLIKTEAKAATETQSGNSAYWTCSTCNKYFSDAEGKTVITENSWIIPALEHTHKLTAYAAKAATCTEDGNTAYWECDKGDNPCHKYFSDSQGKTEIAKDSWVIKATGHQLIHTDAKAATETEDGNKEYWTCSVCKKYYSDVQGKTEIDKTDWFLPAMNHEHKLTAIGAKDATCTEPGNKAYWICDCGKCFSDAQGKSELDKGGLVIPAKGHKAEIIPAVDPTCTKSGLTEGSKCFACGVILKAQDVIPAKGHTSVTDPAVPATETSTGLTEGSHCKDCGEILVKQEFVPEKSSGGQGNTRQNKDLQPMTVKVSRKIIKAKKLKKKKKMISPITVNSAQGTVTYKITGGNKKSKKALKINKNTGKITVKKKTKKGTYKVKVTVKAAGNDSFEAGSKTVEVKLMVK